MESERQVLLWYLVQCMEEGEVCTCTTWIIRGRQVKGMYRMWAGHMQVSGPCEQMGFGGEEEGGKGCKGGYRGEGENKGCGCQSILAIF